MRVLVACEYSGRVRDAFSQLGHDAWSCDFLETETPGQHILGDVRPILRQPWDLVIGHPPCTYLSRAGARWMYPRAGEVCAERLAHALEARELFNAVLSANAPMVCVENPTPLKIVDLPAHSQAIQPYEYGHPFSKRTLLWLRGLPELVPTKVLSEYKPLLRSNTGFGARAGQKNHKGAVSSWKDASRTFEGIATAMAQQWGGASMQAAAQ